MNEGPISVLRLTLGPVQSNCYLIRCDSGSEAVVIDPGAEGVRIRDALAGLGAEPVAVLLTHAHMDHVGAVAEIVRSAGVPVYLHPADLPLYERATEQAAAFGLHVEQPPPPDHELSHGQILELGGIRIEVRHTPGHSPGGVVFFSGEEAFVGDCIFAGSIGRTDLPGGDASTLLRSIRAQILTLPPRTILYSGHGPETTVEREAASNPFLTGAFGWSG
ncbi:MAG: MBL fold metallo-hydrolase [Gemmatimonadota bacterium]